MARLVLAVVLALAAVATARMAYVLPEAAETLLRARSLQTTFTCDNRAYGYYADVDNNCEIFHVCYPIVDETGALLETAHFSFVCGNQTVFNQESLTCSHADDAFPCEEAANLFDISNSEFGVIPERR
ncbi:U-scoloptoxin(01)-Cw1a-like [Homarus americanus]|uniref:U-scoloptoxin(01)-Cw1a-like 12 n=1 Tax=Homarus americanus TaxID=6706 RepID=A0A8J5JHQ2_HOMAM|nr:U-scoloptoxin(01)-Cw1a-like [Homarus americanus]KAG7157381.1 U-scoloptoxin(01)-Cw1a-like 12 [Homarus americanus]